MRAKPVADPHQHIPLAALVQHCMYNVGCAILAVGARDAERALLHIDNEVDRRRGVRWAQANPADAILQSESRWHNAMGDAQALAIHHLIEAQIHQLCNIDLTQAAAMVKEMARG